MREASDHYRQAADAAWQTIQEKLGVVKSKLGIDAVELEGVSYDGDFDLARIDELPDEPKSSHPNHVEVRVSVQARYRIVRQP